MLKALALTLLIATFLASGFTLAPAESVLVSPGLTRTETFTMEKLIVLPLEDVELITTQTGTPSKTDRQDTPKT